MNDYVAERYEHAGVVVEIVQDVDPVNDPQDNDNAGTIYSWVGRQEWDGDEPIDEPDLMTHAEQTDQEYDQLEEVDLPRYMRDNYDAALTIPLRFSDYGSSGARIYVSDDPNCAICFTQKELDEEWNGSVDDATKYAEARVNELDEWMQGYVFGIVIREGAVCTSCEQFRSGAPGAGGAPWLCEDCGGYSGEVLESVWGFIGDLYGESGKYIREEANGLAEAAAREVARERTEAAAWAARGVVTV